MLNVTWAASAAAASHTALLLLFIVGIDWLARRIHTRGRTRVRKNRRP